MKKSLVYSRRSIGAAAPAAAFTLVELLVVIGIISVIVAMLLPALSRAREQAMNIQCLSNLRQIGTYAHMYVQESKGWLPRSRSEGILPVDTFYCQFEAYHLLPQREYLYPSPVFTCPLNPLKKNAHGEFSNYSWNAYLGDSVYPWPHVRMTRVRRPSLIFMALDGPGRYGWELIPALADRVNHSSVWTAPRTHYSYADIGLRAYVHPKQQWNAVFVDGHAHTLERKEFMDNPGYGQENPWHHWYEFGSGNLVPHF